ncbi:unnamed protein product [Rhizophagus irregularis]|nr:unnamed protein product [Rhizophagus irregularis]
MPYPRLKQRWMVNEICREIFLMAQNCGELHLYNTFFLHFRSQSNPDFSDKNTRVYDDNINYGVGLFTLSIYEEFSSKQKEDKEAQNEKVYEAKGVFTQTPKPDHKLDKHPTTYKPGGDVPDIYTHERVPVNEEERRLDEEFKNHMEEIGFEKMLLEAKANIMASKEEKARKKLNKKLKTTSERLVKHKSKMAEDPVIINEELVEEVLEKWPVQNIAKFGKNLTSSYYLEFQEYPNTSETGFANIYNVSGWNEDEA